MAERMCLVDLTAAIDAAGTLGVVRLGNRGYVTEPADVPANTAYAPRLKRMDPVRRQMFSGEKTSGQSSIGLGELVFSNVDGGLDIVRTYSFGGRAVQVRTGSPQNAYGTLTTALRATAGGVELSKSELVVRLKDRQSELDKPLQTNVYGGTNVLPAGVDGTDDIKGKTKPKALGTVFNVSPVCVNTSKLIYQVNDGAIQSLTAYDGGAGLTLGANYVSQVDMETNAPAAGAFRCWPAGGMFRLGSTPAFEITADVVEESGANSTTAQVLKRMALAAGIVGGDISAADVAALDALSTAVIGVYVDDDRPALVAMDEAAAGAGAFFGFDRTGVLRMGRFGLPSGVAVAEINQDNTDTVERVPTLDSLPTWRVTVEYARNHTVQTSGLAGVVTADRRARLTQEVSSVVASDAAVQTQWLDAQTVTRRTPLKLQADAQAEADRLLILYKSARDLFQATGVQLTESLLAALDIGSLVTLRWDRWNLAAGALFVVLGIEADYVRNRADLTLWGTCP